MFGLWSEFYVALAESKSYCVNLHGKLLSDIGVRNMLCYALCYLVNMF
jgi:hypothetical protein